jgi:hypothetical protein
MINYLRKYAQNMIKYIIIHYISCIIGQNYPKKTLRNRPKYHGNSQHIVISMLLTSIFLYGIIPQMITMAIKHVQIHIYN